MNSNCKIIAEIGWNFLGDMNLAKQMIDSAKDNGADFAKFQTWSTKNLVKGPWDHDGRIDLYKKSELNEDKHFELAEYCEKKEIHFLTSVFNSESLAFLKNIKNLKIIKIASMEINNVKLLKEVDKIYEKIIVSTGASNFNEVKDLTRYIDKNKLVLMHCVSSYPTLANNINLPRINSLKKISERVGYSGHLKGINDAIAALSYNIDYIEKHFTTDNSLPGRDNQFSINPDELKKLYLYREEHQKMNVFLGDDMQEIEKDVNQNYRNRWSN